MMRGNRLRRKNGERGQAIVEAAIVLPLYVFLMLGILQLGLMHQARMLTKYAAYKAVRTGSLNNADVYTMEKTALAVLLPKSSLVPNQLVGAITGMEPRLMTFDASGSMAAANYWAKYQMVYYAGHGFALAPLMITICGPVAEDFEDLDHEVDFDDPEYAATENEGGEYNWHRSQRTKLRIQLTFNYRMPIPFANRIISQIALGQEVSRVLMFEQRDAGMIGNILVNFVADLLAAFNNNEFVIPIRANHNMRMMSNIYLGEQEALFQNQPVGLPEENECIFPWNRQ